MKKIITHPDDITMIADIVDGAVQGRLKPVHRKLDGLKEDHEALVEYIGELTGRVDAMGKDLKVVAEAVGVVR